MRADLLLLPGLLCDAALWEAQTRSLRDRADIHIPDLTRDATIATLAERVLAGAPDRFALAGFSMGGCVALEVLARAPERVERLALLSTNVAGIPPGVRQHYLDSMVKCQSGGLAGYLTDAFARYVAPAHAHDEALFRAFYEMGLRVGPSAAICQMRALLDYPGLKYDLSAIACPTLLICGGQDARTTPEMHENMAKEIPHARLTRIPGSGHFTPLEQPAAVSDALLQWLLTAVR